MLAVVTASEDSYKLCFEQGEESKQVFVLSLSRFFFGGINLSVLVNKIKWNSLSDAPFCFIHIGIL